MSAPRAAPPVRWAPLADAGARDTYADLLAASAQASPFSGLAFADAACAAYRLTGHLLLAGDPGGLADGGLVVFEKRRGPLRAAALPPYAEFVTPVLRVPLEAALVHARATPLDAIARAVGGRYPQASLRLHPTLADARPLAWAGWRLTPAWHAEAPLDGDAPSGGADPLAAWTRSARKTLRQSADAYTVDEGADLVDEAVRLAAESMAAKGMAHPPTAPVAAVASALAATGEAMAFVARHDGVAEAGLVAALGDTTAYYWIVGSRPGPAMTVLVAHLARAAHAAGRTRLHFGGANVPSVAEFKRSLGGALVPVLRARWARGPLAVRDALAGANLRFARR